MKLILVAALSWWPIAISAVLLLAAAAARLRATRGPICRGHLPRRWRLFSAHAWLGRCGYDLSRLPADGAGLVRCPECAARTPADAIARRPRRGWPLVRAAALVLMLAAAAHTARYLRTGVWTQYISDATLLRVRSWLGPVCPAVLRFELLSRINASPPTLNAADLQAAVPLVIAELRDDHIAGNAEAAIEALSSPLWAYSTPGLLQALDSDDWQQRQLAANLLVRRDEPPSPRLLQVLVEALRDDALPAGSEGRRSYTYIWNAQAATTYLTDNDADATPLLAEALASSDWQQRFLAAVILGAAHREELADRAVPILIEHLDRNAIDEDAKGAVVGLVSFGAAALPHLDSAAADPDPQRAALVRVVRRRIAANIARHSVGPPAPDSPLVTVVAKDPAADITALGDATLLTPNNLHVPSRR